MANHFLGLALRVAESVRVRWLRVRLKVAAPVRAEVRVPAREVVFLLRGKHTTRVSELLEFGGGFLVDTPGFSAVDLTEAGLDKNNLRHCFKEFKNFVGACKFRNVCSHSHEPDCGVKAAVQRGEILRERYDAYLTLLAEVH